MKAESMNAPSRIRCAVVGVILCSAFLALGGCATPQSAKIFHQQLQSRAIDPALQEKVKENQPLQLPEIEYLVSQNIPDIAIISYLQGTGAAYHLRLEDVDHLRQAKVPDSIVNYLMSTQRIYPPAGPVYYYPAPYYYDPFYFPPPPPVYFHHRHYYRYR